MTPDVCGGSAAICLEEWRDKRGGNKGGVGMGSVGIELAMRDKGKMCG